jgi:hypothetical protein
MDYGMIGQIAKAKHYAEERHRITFNSLIVTLNGTNNSHTVKYNGSTWESDSSFFQAHGWCSHTVALERILQDMVHPADPAEGKEPASNSSMISQIEKAKRYTDERNRVHFTSFKAAIAGENNAHTVDYENGKWSCDCHFFHSHEWCSHTMALERILQDMVIPGTVEQTQ